MFSINRYSFKKECCKLNKQRSNFFICLKTFINQRFMPTQCKARKNKFKLKGGSVLGVKLRG